ncbi:exodeoxyribonuclease VIII [Lelliottia nimipressuralis]|uniref:Exodeoxyribonuclease VIII n=1 Tax=Lelliottia nimipressuralis TaxID=69220 RepID=A0ABY3P755_9ENTR|nr:exodeoxyribonuclease VIII [Lelliottia nimipressuralis]RXJ10468.1 exodeoxyribonuclease VIII [Lelliottia nimipressuralis]TYT34963.1 exodeoxyribonuclease VIII [Lelliottia nimipressuralis]
MSVELKVFGGALFVKDKALKEHPDLKPLAIFVNAAKKGVAEAIIAGKFAENYPANIEDYFKVKIWEHRDELPQVAADPGVFCADFFENVAIWNASAGEPVAKTAEPESPGEELPPALKLVSVLDKASRAAALVLFGPVIEISPAQYGQIVDLINDEDGHFERELAEAVSRESRVLALAPERQSALLAWVRETAKDSAQWTDLVKLLAKWLDAPADKRPQASTSNDNRTDTGATLGSSNQTDRSPDLVHGIATLRIEVAVGILSLHDDIDIYAIPSRILIPAKAMAEAEQDTRFTTWWKLLRATPGILDYSRAAIIALIKSTPEALWLKPIELREHINRELVEFDHANPDQKTIDIACSAAPRIAPGKQENEKTQQIHDDKAEIPAVCPARAAELDKELNAAFADSGNQEQPKIENLGGGAFTVDALIANAPSNEGEKQEVPPAPSDREIEIAHALNDLIYGRTPMMGDEEAAGVVSCTGHLVQDVIPLLISDIATIECCLSPDFSDEEIHDIATTMLDAWSDDINVRQKIALDAIVEYRRPEPPKSAVLSSPSVTAKSNPATEPAREKGEQHAALSFRQQLTIAALQGLCANPAYSRDGDDLAHAAVEIVDEVMRYQESGDEH